MFGDARDKRNESGVTLIAANCEFVGDVHFTDELIVNGTVKGNIHAQPETRAVIRVHEQGLVRGDIEAPRVVINGKVFGDIRSGKHIELAAKSEVQGSIYYHVIEMVKGARLDGQLVHVQSDEQGDKKKAKKPADEIRTIGKAGREAMAPAAAPGAGR